MKFTYNPKDRDSAFQAVVNGGNFSEPDRRDSKKQRSNKNMFSNFE